MDVSQGQERPFFRNQLTRSSLINLLRCNSESREYLKHYFCDNTHHLGRRYHFGIKLEPSKEILDADKEANELILARIDILGCLTDADVTCTAWTRRRKSILTRRRAPIPVKIGMAGEISEK